VGDGVTVDVGRARSRPLRGARGVTVVATVVGSRAPTARASKGRASNQKHLEEAATVPEDETAWEKMAEHVATLR